jgi:tRNA threonylcarbamoyladenosine biosynthesis protein TsaB
MKILAIDTSATAASVCLAEENKILGEFFTNTALTHSRTLVPMVEQVLKTTDTDIEELDYIAVNSGPGSFTGVRIGVAAVKGLAFKNDLPCVSVSTLESMAYNLLGCDCVVCAVMDARCSQVYNAMFKISGNTVERLCGDRALALPDLKQELEKISDKIMLVGDGAEICCKFLGDSLPNVFLTPINNRFQNASSTAMAAFKSISDNNILTPAELMPTYLRLPQAQRELNKRLGRE